MQAGRLSATSKKAPKENAPAAPQQTLALHAARSNDKAKH